MRTQLLNLMIYAEEELKKKSLDELESIVEQFKAKLNLTENRISPSYSQTLGSQPISQGISQLF